MNLRYLVLVLWIGFSCGKDNSTPVTPPPAPSEATFRNPIQNGADPFVYRKDGQYYYMQTVGNRVDLWRTEKMSELNSARRTTIFTPPATGANSRNLWAPEIYFLNGKWYVYYTAGSDTEEYSQRTWVLENASADPTQGTWTQKGRLFNPENDNYALDGNVLEHNGSLYFLWSGWPKGVNKVERQEIYISKMGNPWTLTGKTTLLTTPELNWERNGFGVNEGPQVLKNPQGRVFMIYSASYCGTDDYALGMLSLREGGDPLNAADWTKTQQPVFTKSPSANAFGPGHNCFFQSPNGSENWLLYHANTNTGEGCGERRNIRMQPFTFTSSGLPQFGEPVATGRSIAVPAGE
ncbi:family 43 glycosylhydrolase [Siphonobacter sp.]|uniref:glycoside hydrolase family 43 protein n=1 Tax=Siphonobacter sp. TaxID=1869184 RepID=UPI003B3B4F8D